MKSYMYFAGFQSRLTLVTAVFTGLILVTMSAQAQNQAVPVEPGEKPVHTESANPGEPNQQPPVLVPPPTPPSPVFTLTIRQKGTGKPIKRAEIAYGTEKIYTEADGNVKFVIPDGIEKITIYRAGFEKATLAKEDFTNLSALEIFLFPATPDDNEVIIRGKKRFEISKKTVSIQEAKKIAPRGDVVQITKLLPGVQADAFGPDIIVRGSGPEDSKYYIDEWKVPFIFHSVGGLSVLNPELLSDIEFTTGGFGAQYGEATGGIIGIKTKQEVPEDNRFEFLVNLPLYSGVFYETPIGEGGKSFGSIAGRRSYIDAILPSILPDDMNLTLTPYFSDAQAYYYRQLDDGHLKWIFLSAVDGFKLLFDTEFSTEEDGRGEFDISQSFYTTGIEWKRKLDNDWSVTISPQITHFENNFNFLDNYFRLYVNSFDLRTEFSKRRSRYEKTYIGAEITYGVGTVKVLAPQGDFNDPFFDFEEAPRVKVEDKGDLVIASTWYSYDKKLGDFIVTPGIRALHATEIRKTTADPRFATRYLLNKENTLKLAIGQYSQVPNNRDTSEQFGNPDLEFIRTTQYVLGIETDWSDRWKTDFQIFHKKLFNLVESAPRPTNVDSTGSGESSGFEAFVRRNATARLFGWFSYTYSQNMTRENDQITYRNSKYDQTHIVNVALNYAISGTWDLGGKLTYHTGDTFTGVDYGVYNANLDKYQQRANPNARLYEDRLPDFHEINIYAEKDTLFDTWKLQWRFGVEFLAFSPQARSVQYNYDYSKEEYFTSLPPIPYFEVKGVL